jgi:hypothetical protein
MDSTAVIDAVTIPITVDFLEEDQVYQVSKSSSGAWRRPPRVETLV